jgi:hypothetical protein
MEATMLGDAKQDQAMMHFAAAKLGDKRRTDRLVRSVRHILEHPQGSLPQKMNTHSELIGLYRLLDCDRVTHQAVQQPHRDLLRQRLAQQSGVVLLVHDTTELDFSSIAALEDQLGQIGNGSGHGLLCHNTLVITPDRNVLGLAAQVLHRRRKVPRNETPKAKRQHPQRESRLWIKGCELAGAAPDGVGFVDVADRGADSFEFIEHEHLQHRSYVIRACKDRNLEGLDHLGSDRIHHKLYAYARDLPQLGQRTLELPATPKREARTARLSVSAGPLQLRASRFARGDCLGIELKLWVIRVAEIDAPAGQEPLEWVLLTDMAVLTLQQANQKIDYYCCRWTIEDFHKSIKTGLKIQAMQLKDAARLEPMIGILSVVGAVLLELRDAAREPDAESVPATSRVPLLYVQILSHHWYKKLDEQMNIKQFVRDVARLGGFLGRKSDGSPGWQTLWRGWHELHRMVQGALAFQQMRCV